MKTLLILLSFLSLTQVSEAQDSSGSFSMFCSQGEDRYVVSKKGLSVYSTVNNKYELKNEPIELKEESRSEESYFPLIIIEDKKNLFSITLEKNLKVFFNNKAILNGKVRRPGIANPDGIYIQCSVPESALDAINSTDEE